MPELPEMEIVARRLGEALAGETIESAVAPGINALKTFDPPLSALDGAAIEGVRRRGKLLMLDAGGLTLLMHLMSAGRLQLFTKHATLRDRTARVGLRLSEGRELRLREFGTRQRAWVKLLTPEALAADEALTRLGPGGVARPARPLRAAAGAPAAALAPARPGRRNRDRAHVGRRDPARREALALQARRRPLRRGRRAPARRDGLRARARARRL